VRVWVLRKEDYSDKVLSKRLLEYVYFKLMNKKIELDKLTYNQYGKPYYDGFYFNISHSKNFICIVTSFNEVGIDIEEERKIVSGLEKKILTSEELKDNNLNILECWVIKEAYSKYKGLGLRLPFNKVSILDIKKELSVFNLNCNDFYCYAIGSEEFEGIEYLNVRTIMGDFYE
jgi:4'-phosphopantetheinyl transferase